MSGADANVCGFAAVCFVSKALDVLLETVESSDDTFEEAGRELSEALSQKLHAIMTAQAGEYKQYRRAAKIGLVHACHARIEAPASTPGQGRGEGSGHIEGAARRGSGHGVSGLDALASD